VPTLTEDIRNGKTVTAIAQENGVSRQTIYNRMKTQELSHQKLKFNHDFFENIDCEEKAYWLGFIMADGCVSVTQQPKMAIGLHKRDEDHLKKWHQSIRSCLKIHHHKDRVASTHYSSKMCHDLIQMGCVPRKSLQLEFPDLREDLIRHFVRGYFDGDGSILRCRPNQNTCRTQLRIVFIGTQMFLNTLKKWIQCSANVCSMDGNRAYRLEIHGNKSALSTAKLMYENATIYLDRKAQVYYSSL